MTPWLQARLVVDRAVAAFLALVVSPVVALAALLVRRDGGPAFIKVTRVGRGGKRFGMWKLRSMHADGVDGRAVGATLTDVGDDRITSIGRHLRAYHLDELPQLANVVRGQMSLLGPRPEAPEFVEWDDPAWQEVLSVPPGIAGPTQVIVNDWERQLIAEDPDGSVYREKVVPVKLAIDGWYLRASSPITDLLVLVTLVRRYLPGTGSWTLRQRVSREVPEARHVMQTGRPSGSRLPR